jgi:hypothetical protein
MKDRTELEALFQKHGYRDFKWLDPGEVVSQWVRTKRNAPLGFMQAEADSGIRPRLFLKTSLTSHPPAYIV